MSAGRWVKREAVALEMEDCRGEGALLAVGRPGRVLGRGLPVLACREATKRGPLGPLVMLPCVDRGRGLCEL